MEGQLTEKQSQEKGQHTRTRVAISGLRLPEHGMCANLYTAESEQLLLSLICKNDGKQKVIFLSLLTNGSKF